MNAARAAGDKFAACRAIQRSAGSSSISLARICPSATRSYLRPTSARDEIDCRGLSSPGSSTISDGSYGVSSPVRSSGAMRTGPFEDFVFDLLLRRGALRKPSKESAMEAAGAAVFHFVASAAHSPRLCRCGLLWRLHQRHGTPLRCRRAAAERSLVNSHRAPSNVSEHGSLGQMARYQRRKPNASAHAIKAAPTCKKQKM
jgi:hypothetical protein